MRPLLSSGGGRGLPSMASIALPLFASVSILLVPVPLMLYSWSRCASCFGGNKVGQVCSSVVINPYLCTWHAPPLGSSLAAEASHPWPRVGMHSPVAFLSHAHMPRPCPGGCAPSRQALGCGVAGSGLSQVCYPAKFCLGVQARTFLGRGARKVAVSCYFCFGEQLVQPVQ